ncbi:MAG: glycine zipper domain-containing protein [Thermodesulfobacteriota bacterium]
MKRTNRWKNLGMTVVAAGLLAAAGNADLAEAELIIYPAKGQSAELQKKDTYECHQWAVEQSGYDPTSQQPESREEDKVDKSAARKGAARGALIGLGIGSLSGNAGKGAAAGAGVGVIAGKAQQQQQRHEQENAQKEAEKKQQEKLEHYNKAKCACLEGRGYTVK